jgi:cytochrome P450
MSSWPNSLTCPVPDSLVATQPHDLHRKRRAALNPYFSKANIRRLDPVIQSSANAILKRLDDCAKTSTVFPASLAYKAATCDVITEFSFGVSTEYIAREDYEEAYFDAVDHHLKMCWTMTYVPGVGTLLDSMPPTIMGWIYPGLKQLWLMHSVGQ